MLQSSFIAAFLKVFIKLIITMSYRWLLHYCHEFISKNLEISRRTEVNRRDLVGLVLQAKCESQAFFISLALVHWVALEKYTRLRFRFAREVFVLKGVRQLGQSTMPYNTDKFHFPITERFLGITRTVKSKEISKI